MTYDALDVIALWGRVPLSSLVVEGDAALVAALRTG